MQDVTKTAFIMAILSLDLLLNLMIFYRVFRYWKDIDAQGERAGLIEQALGALCGRGCAPWLQIHR